MATTKSIELSSYFDIINRDSIRIKGHRIGIEHILAYYLEGYNPEEIAKEFPGLSLEKIYATITYYLANRDEIDAYLQRRRIRDEQAYQEWAANPSPVIERLRVIREEQTDYK
jgi:uncharacterized protein (DUF433 family)